MTFSLGSTKNRVKIANAVAKFKNKLTQKQLAARTKVTEFIAEKKSRQEFEPILGPVIDKGFAEPLHLANNNWQFLFWNFSTMFYIPKQLFHTLAKKFLIYQ